LRIVSFLSRDLRTAHPAPALQEDITERDQAAQLQESSQVIEESPPEMQPAFGER
jgi:hypothetical protein